MNAPEERRITRTTMMPSMWPWDSQLGSFRFLIRLEKGDGEEGNGNRQKLWDTCTPEHFAFSLISLNVEFVGSNVER